MKNYKVQLMALFFPFLALSGSATTTKSILSIDKVGAASLTEQIDPIEGVPFNMPQFKRPVFPQLTVNIINKGATEIEPITTIINQAITEVSKQGGGAVIIPKGKWKSGRIILKSNVNLHLAEGAELEFPGTAEEYLPPVFTRHEGIEVMGPGSFIYADGEDNIAITGKGVIYGPPMNAEIRQRPNGNTVVENDITFNMPIEQRITDGMNGRYILSSQNNCAH